MPYLVAFRQPDWPPSPLLLLVPSRPNSSDLLPFPGIAQHQPPTKYGLIISPITRNRQPQRTSVISQASSAQQLVFEALPRWLYIAGIFGCPNFQSGLVGTLQQHSWHRNAQPVRKRETHGNCGRRRLLVGKEWGKPLPPLTRVIREMAWEMQNVGKLT
jgi:hypothetical protein